MKIAVIGVYFASNLGDAVICDCVAKWFRDAYPQAQVDVIDINGNTEFEVLPIVSLRTLQKRQNSLKKDYWLARHGFRDKVYYWSNKNMENRMDFYGKIADRGYDFAVFAGGQLFMDWLSLDVCEFLKHFERTKTPVFFNACGVGVSVSKQIKERVQKYLNSDNVRFISTRDDVEKIGQRYLREGKKAIPTYDPALWTLETYQIERKDSEVIGLGVMYCSHIRVRKLIRFWVNVIKELEKRNIPWKMFCNGSMDDYNLGCHVLERLHLEKDKFLCLCAKKPETLIEQISGFKGVISFRLHSHIIAASLDIPAVALVWDDKLRFFYRHLHHEERCMTVRNPAIEVVDQLEKALTEGYDRDLIEKQKEYAHDLLLGAVKDEFR